MSWRNVFTKTHWRTILVINAHLEQEKIIHLYRISDLTIILSIITKYFDQQLVMLEVVQVKAVLLNFHVSLFHVDKRLKRTKYKPENESFSSYVGLSSTHACSYKIDNFILKSHVTFTKLFSNWLYGGKIPKQLDVVPSGNKFSENFSRLAILK